MNLKFIKYMESWLYSTIVIPTLNATQENMMSLILVYNEKMVSGKVN